MSTIILPQGCTRQDRDGLMVEAMHDMAFEERFAWNPEFAHEVTKLHMSRMMSADSARWCVQCMKLVAQRDSGRSVRL